MSCGVLECWGIEPQFTTYSSKPRRYAKKQAIKKHLNKKFLEVQKPFFKKVSGRRRHKLTVDSGEVKTEVGNE
jgi:hypothetical protein